MASLPTNGFGLVAFGLSAAQNGHFVAGARTADEDGLIHFWAVLAFGTNFRAAVLGLAISPVPSSKTSVDRSTDRQRPIQITLIRV